MQLEGWLDLYANVLSASGYVHGWQTVYYKKFVIFQEQDFVICFISFTALIRYLCVVYTVDNIVELKRISDNYEIVPNNHQFNTHTLTQGKKLLR